MEPFVLEDPAKLDDPFADLAWLREHRPVLFRESLGQWFVFGYEDVRALFADSRLGTNRVEAFVEAVPTSTRGEVRALLPFFASWLMMSDGDEHSRLRRLMHQGFGARAIKALAEPTERVANELVDRRVSHGCLDISEDFGLLLPAYVLAEFVGAPSEDRDRFVAWSLDFVQFFNEIPITEEATRAMVATTVEMREYFRRLVAERRRRRRGDFLGTMVAQSDPRDAEAEEKIIANTVLLVLAGHLPVRNLIGNAVWLLLSRPQDAAAVQGDPTLLVGAVDETLRYEPPVTLIPRIPREDLDIRGQTLPAGAIVQLSIAAANRDPHRFSDPDRFDLRRNAGGILSFGHGPHGCLGARLAREQSVIGLRVLFERLQEMHIDEHREICWYRNATNRGPDRLPVVFRASA